MPKGEKSYKHGMCGTRIYQIFESMKARTSNPNNTGYKNYGAKGITICKEWLDEDKGFINFYNWSMANGYQDDLTIDRIDVRGNYEPINCRWVTMKAQGNNRTNNRFVTYNNVTMTTAEWSAHLGGDRHLVSERLRLGWSEEEAVTTPCKSKKFDFKHIEFSGRVQSLTDWSKETGISVSTLTYRIKQGWNIEKVFNSKKDS